MTWTIQVVTGTVTLTSQDDAGRIRECGRAEEVLLPDVVAFALDQADSWDRVVTPTGVSWSQAQDAGGSRA